MSERDITTGGHPRTLKSHQDARLRSQQRAALTNERPVVEKSGLHLDKVVDVNSLGGVQLSRFRDPETGGGQYFSCLNFTSPRIGDVVIYSYADDSPIVLGKMPDYRIPWRVPEWHGQDTFFFDDFDLGGNSTAGFSLARWLVSVQTSGSYALSPGTFDRPGQMILTNIAAVGSYAILYNGLGASGLIPESLSQIGFSFFTTNSQGGAAQTLIGLVDSAIVANWICLFGQGATFSIQWNTSSPAASLNIDTGVPYYDGHWYTVVMTRLTTATWAFHIIDVTDLRVNGPFILNNCPTTVAMFPMCRLYNLTGSGTRQINIDYFWWSRNLVPR